jgi:hypothetical protein
MNPTISFDEFNNNACKNAIEIASAISHIGISNEEKIDLVNKEDFEKKFSELVLKNLYQKETTLYIPAMPNTLGDGDVASNFRFKHDKDTNNEVIKKWMKLFTINSKQKNPIVITTVSRDQRYLTLKMLENGKIKIMNNISNIEVTNLTLKFTNFLEALNIDTEKMKLIRESSKGARYNSYLSDMIGFINMVNWASNNKSIFIEKYLEAHVETEGEVYYRQEVKGELIIKPVIVNNREWKPKEKYDYMYFRKTDKLTPTLQKFYMLKDGEITNVYLQIFNALSMNENDTKKLIRNFMINHNYIRLSDYWVNDVDDAFTILMILNCFDDDDIELTEEENIIKTKLELLYDTIIN